MYEYQSVEYVITSPASMSVLCCMHFIMSVSSDAASPGGICYVVLNLSG